MTKINKLIKWIKSPIRIGIASMFILIVTYTLLAKPGGITGRTAPGAGCSCHGSSSSSTSVGISGNFTVDPGSNNNYTVTVSNSSQMKAGVNIAVKNDQSGETNVGSVFAGSNLQALSGELTHTSPVTLSGGSAGFSFTWTAPSQAGEYYIRAAGNAVDGDGSNSGDEWNFMTPKKVTVKGVQLTSPNGGESWCAGSTKDINWTKFGVTDVKIELSSDGGNSWPTTITGSTSGTSYSWNIPSESASGSSYRIRVSDASNSNLKDVSGSSFSITGTPSISSNPESKTACTGTSVSFTVSASGSGLNYQWRKNSTNISGANSSTYNISSVKLTDAGNYDCVVSNACGSPVTSTQATLSVDETPSITTQPVSKTVCKGSVVNFSVTAAGTNISYQWKKNNVNIDGATQSSYTINSADDADAGTYSVAVSGKCNPPAVSTNATLTIAKPAVITKHPEDKEVCVDAALFMGVESTGSGLTYQWRKNGVNIQNAKESTLLIQKVKESDSGNYDVIVTGQCGSPVTSSPAIVKINIKPVITKQPGNLKINENTQAKFSVQSNNGTGYQWRKNNTNLQGETNFELIIAKAALDAAGTFDCIVKNACGETSSASALLEIVPAGSGPTLTLSSNQFDFSKKEVGTVNDETLDNLVKNTGDKELIISGISISGADASEFKILNPPVNPIKLQPDKTFDLQLSFEPKSPGTKTAVIQFTSNAEVNPSFELMGYAYSVGISLNTESIDFGEIMGGESALKEFSVKNTGSENLTINRIIIGGDNPESFELISPLSEVILKPDSLITVQVKYLSTGDGAKSAVVSIETDAKTFEDVITINATGFPNSVENLSAVKEFSVFPNPGSEKAEIRFLSVEAGEYELVIFDNTGRIVRKFNGEMPGNQAMRLIWDLTDNSGNKISTGKYSVAIISNNKINSIDIIISR
jgi:hypothetical protein